MNKEIIDYYDGYDEEGRLFRSNSHKIEWLTSMHYFKKLFQKNAFLLDGCAGTGNYAFPLAKMGYQVVAGDLVPGNVEIMRNKQKKDPVLKDTYVGSMTDLSQFGDATFDVVLCMGAFYHVDQDERNLIIEECMRVLKTDGMLAISYINTMAGVLSGLDNELKNMDEITDWFHNKTREGLFLFMTPSQMEEMASKYNAKIVAHVAADGINYLISNKLNCATDTDFDKWFQFHLQTCEDKSLLGYSLHGLIIISK